MNGKRYICRAVLHKEADGGFSVICTNLPGVASQGDTEAEAIENIKEAFSGAIECYLEDGGEIPWAEPGEPDEYPKTICPMVDVEEIQPTSGGPPFAKNERIK